MNLFTIRVRAPLFVSATLVLGATLMTHPSFAADAPDKVEAPVTGFEFNGTLTTVALDNLRGGLKTGGVVMSDLDLTLSWKGEQGWDAFVYAILTNNGKFSERYTGDAQVVSNIDFPAGVRLAEAWVRKTSADQKWESTFGFINANNVFDVQDVGALFLQSSHGIGIEFAQSGVSNKPMAALGIVEQWHVKDDLTLKAGYFDAVGGDPDHGSVFAACKLSSEIGAQYQIEIEKDFKGGYVKLGHWANTQKADYLDGSGQTRVFSGDYGQLSLTLHEEKDTPDQGLKGWLRAGQAEAVVLPVDRYLGTGLVYTGLIKGRDNDQVGIAMAQARFGKPYRATQAQSVGTETSYEITYAGEVRPGFVIQPEVQFIKHPSGERDIKNAMVVGVQVRIGLEAFKHP